jgi:hypothetical protein
MRSRGACKFVVVCLRGERDRVWGEFYAGLSSEMVSLVYLRELMHRWIRLDDVIRLLS